MLVYTTLFTLVGKNPKENKYVDMFYMWLTYLKKYGGLGPNDCVGLIVDEDTLEFINSEQPFGYICLHSQFSIEISTICKPRNVLEGMSERYNIQHYIDNFTKHELNMYMDIDCLCIKNIHSLFLRFAPFDATFFVIKEGFMVEDNYGNHLIKEEEKEFAESLPGFSAGWHAWTYTQGQLDFFNSVLKRCKEWNSPFFYTIEQPFFNYELFLRMIKKKEKDFKICVIENTVIADNPLVFNSSLDTAYFANFCGNPGKDSCHYNKMLGFMYVSFLYMGHSEKRTDIVYNKINYIFNKQQEQQEPQKE